MDISFLKAIQKCFSRLALSILVVIDMKKVLLYKDDGYWYAANVTIAAKIWVLNFFRLHQTMAIGINGIIELFY